MLTELGLAALRRGGGGGAVALDIAARVPRAYLPDRT